MGAPISSFETVESIRFFAQLVGTEGVSQEVKDKANEYMLRLINSLGRSVDEVTATSAGLQIV
jgi:hypothetical protein